MTRAELLRHSLHTKTKSPWDIAQQDCNVYHSPSCNPVVPPPYTVTDDFTIPAGSSGFAEAESAALASGKSAEDARERALDPASKAVVEARRQMEDSAFRRERLQTAVSRLRERLKEVRAQEENQRRWIAYEKVKAERDSLAAELKASYPSMESRLGELIAKIEANDREIEYIQRPSTADGRRAPSKCGACRSRNRGVASEICRRRADQSRTVPTCLQTRSAPAVRMAASTIARSRLTPLSDTRTGG